MSAAQSKIATKQHLFCDVLHRNQTFLINIIYCRRLRFSSDADNVRLTNAYIIIFFSFNTLGSKDPEG